ncbi:MAG: amidohydrolase, partial [Vicinamibacteria bacterium]
MIVPARRRPALVLAIAIALAPLAPARATALDASPLAARLDAALAANEGALLEWRRHLHQHPELGNREVETAKFVADKLRSFGLEPRTGVAKTGVVAVIEGGKPGPVVALRADMDALPVAEAVDLPFASRVTTTWEGKTVGVMHACGHDTHVAMLLDAAQALASVRKDLPGRVVLLFQPAEEGVPADEGVAGAELMVKEGVLDQPKVDAVFGLHVFAQLESGVLGYRSGPMMAAGDRFEIVVHGRQTHGSKPWAG